MDFSTVFLILFCYGFLLLIGVITVIVITFYLISYLLSLRRGPVTLKPKVPGWILEEPRIYKYLEETSGVRIYGRAYQPLKNGKMEAIDKIRKIIAKHTDNQVIIPDNTCLVQVPMAGFKCGLSCTDFEVISDSEASESESLFSYQMFGSDKIQVIRLIKDDKVLIAGFCIYIWWPYDQGIHYQEAVINSCYQLARSQRAICPSAPPEEISVV